MNEHRFQFMVLIVAITAMAFTMGCSRVSSEMKDVVDNFETPDKRIPVLSKYDRAGVVPDEIKLCTRFAKPVVAESEKKDGISYYTLEAMVEACEHSPAAVGTVRVFTMGWMDGNIVAFEWGGPKSGRVEY